MLFFKRTHTPWERWFAWRPVKLDGREEFINHQEIRDCWAWLRWVEASRLGNSGWFYRSPALD